MNKKRLNQSPEEPPSPKKLSKMTANEVGRMDIEELMDAMGQLLDKKLEHLATKEDVQKEMQVLRDENEGLKKSVEILHNRGSQLEARIESLENLARKNNIIVYGIPKHSSNIPNNVTKFCEEVMGVRNINIHRAHYIGKPEKNAVLVELASSNEVSTILSKGRSLKNTGVRISRDYTKETRVKRAKLFKVRKILLQNNKDLKVLVKGAKLEIEGMQFFESGGTITTEVTENMGKLKSLFNENVLSCFVDLNNLDKYFNNKNE